jgi:DHA1 family tetracycline resistance protein-like MFS transporter
MRLLFALIFLDLLGFGIVVPVLPFIALHLGASVTEVTSLSAAYSAALLLAAPVWGHISDTWGRKPVLLLAFFGTSVAFSMMAFASAVWMLFLARAFAGLMSGDIAAAPAYVSDITPPEKRARNMGFIGAAFGLAFTIGPGIGGTLFAMLPEETAFRVIPMISAFLSITTLILAAKFLPESLNRHAEGEGPVTHAFTFKHMTLVVAIVFFISAAFAAMEATLPLWAKAMLGWGPEQVGYLLVVAGVVAVIAQGGLIGPLTRIFGEPKVVILAGVLLFSGMAGIALAEGKMLLIFGIACLAGGFGLGNPALQSLISQLSGRLSAGSALGIAQATSSLARIFGPPSAGLLFEEKGPAAPYVIGAIVMLGVVFLAIALLVRLRRDPVSLVARS